jgi:predicted nicotinamide N-methyase
MAADERAGERAGGEEDQEAIFHDALRWFAPFDVQHTVDPFEGVYTYERTWDPDTAAYAPAQPHTDPAPAAAAEASKGEAVAAAKAVESGPAQLRVTVATLADRTLVRLFAHFVWNAALVLTALVDHGAVRVRGRRVVELGAGAGLPSLAAALQGAAAVVVTDYPAPPFLDNLRANVARNLPPGPRAAVTVLGHAFGDPVAPLLAAGSGGARISHADGAGHLSAAARPPALAPEQWPQPGSEPAHMPAPLGKRAGHDEEEDDDGRFDVVLLADVLWMESLHGPLLASCRALVRPAAQGGRVVLAYGEHTGAGIPHAFLDRAAGAEGGFRVRPVHRYRFPTEWGSHTRLDNYNEARRTVYTYQLELIA